MNHWKIVWDAYTKGATRWAFFCELWRLASWKLRIAAFACLVGFGWGGVEVMQDPGRETPWLLFASEFGFLMVLYHVRGELFQREYGSPDSALSPSEAEDYRASRFLMFKAALRAKNITKHHVSDLSDGLAARDELEAQRNGILNRFLAFASGFISATVLTLIRGADGKQQLYILLITLGACVLLVPLLWLIPSRKERMKELKYFLVLYGKSA